MNCLIFSEIHLELFLKSPEKKPDAWTFSKHFASLISIESVHFSYSKMDKDVFIVIKNGIEGSGLWKGWLSPKSSRKMLNCHVPV